MEKIRSGVFIFFICFFAGNSLAQKAPIIRKGLLRAQATLSPSYMFADKGSYFYLHGNMEGYVSDKISISGEGYYNLGNSSGNTTIFDYNHSLFFGASWHFTKKNNDLYLGLQPGLSFTKINEAETLRSKSQMGLDPLFSTVLGYNFYVNRFFHFFLQSRLIIGQHVYDVPVDISELRFSAGLGFNLNTIKSN